MAVTRVVAVTVAAAAAIVTAVSPAAADDVSTLVRNHQAATARAAVVAGHAPDLEPQLRSLVDTAYTARIVATHLAAGGDTADFETVEHVVAAWSPEQIDQALSVAQTYDPADGGDATPLEPLPALNYHGLQYAPPPPDETDDGDAEPTVPISGQCPVYGNARFINDWGFPRSGGRWHQGNDLFAPRGTPLVAIDDGTVVRVNRPGDALGLGGLTVTINIAGVDWYYAHLDQIASELQPGDTVTAGQQIGTVGSTGNASAAAPHLHLGRYVDGAPTNPYPYLRRIC